MPGKTKTISPSTNLVVCEVQEAGIDDIQVIARQSQDAFFVWRNVPLADRHLPSLLASGDPTTKRSRNDLVAKADTNNPDLEVLFHMLNVVDQSEDPGIAVESIVF